MPQLLVRNVPEKLVKQLKRRAVEHGVSAEEEHRRILQHALAAPSPAKQRTLFDHLDELGRIAPKFELVRERQVDPRRKVEFR